MGSWCRRLLAVTLAVTGLAVGTPPATADGPPDPLLSEASRRLATTPDLAALLIGRYVADRDAEAAARTVFNDALFALDQARRDRQSQAERLAVTKSDLIDARRDQAWHETSLVQLLQGSLTNTIDGSGLLLLQPEKASDLQFSSELSDSAARQLRELLKRDAGRINRLERDQLTTSLLLRHNEARRDAAQAAVTEATTHLDAAVRALDESRTVLRSVIDTRKYPDLNIRPIVLDAYLHATAAMAFKDPGCGLEWWALAAVGGVESSHVNGRAILDNGDVLDPIIGPTLDGSGDNRTIADTDGGSLDGDPEWDHAVGPMQFTPETWRALGVDGNGDRYADVNNVYDATMSAARKLCRDREGLRLDTIDGYATSLFAYNTSDKYVTRVFKTALALQKTEVSRSHVVNVLSGPRMPIELNALTDQLTQHAYRPSFLSVGDAGSALRAITPLWTADPDDARPRAIAGHIVVLSDLAWSADDQVALIKGILRNGGGLAIVWVPAPKSEVPEVVRAFSTDNPQFHIAEAPGGRSDVGPLIETLDALMS